MGFGAVGVLIVVLALGVWRQVGARVAALLIAVSGIAFAAAGVFPADMSNFDADTTRLHILASLVSLAGFVIAVPFMGWRLWRSGRRGFAVAAIAFGLAVVLTLLLRETEMPPGLAQRINFLGYLTWMAPSRIQFGHATRGHSIIRAAVIRDRVESRPLSHQVHDRIDFGIGERRDVGLRRAAGDGVDLHQLQSGRQRR